MFTLDGKVAIITGSSRGIGRAIAEEYVKAGAKVVISSRNQQDCDNVSAELNKLYGNNSSIGVASDLSDHASLQYLIDQTHEKLGKIDILVCNAANNPHFGPLATISDDNFRQLFEENILANHWLVQMTVPDMVERQEGTIIIISSIGGLRGSDFIGGYNITKAANIQFTRNLAVEYGRHNIRVNTIAPGSVRTELSRPLWEDPKHENSLASSTVLGRISEPHEIAGSAVFLASPASTYITGHTLIIDGGRTIQSNLFNE